MKKLFVFLMVGISFGAFGFSSNLEKWVTEIAEITGKNYVYTIKLEGEVRASENVKIEKENADKFLSWLLLSGKLTVF